MRKLMLSAVIGIGLLTPNLALAGEHGAELSKQDWSFDGMFGKFDRDAVKKGGQIYFEVCAACHSMNLLSYRNLVDISWTEAEAKAIAAEYEVEDGPDDEGEMFMRPGMLPDRFVSPYPNEKASRYANGGAFPPDLSVITKARKGGADYIYSLLTGFREEAPEEIIMAEGMSYNTVFPNNQIAMSPPLSGETVEFADGTTATLEQEALYVANFLTWASEPELEARKSLGIKVLLYLFVLTGLLYALKRRIWNRICLDEYTHGPYVDEFQKSLDNHKLPG